MFAPVHPAVEVWLLPLFWMPHFNGQSTSVVCVVLCMCGTNIAKNYMGRPGPLLIYQNLLVTAGSSSFVKDAASTQNKQWMFITIFFCLLCFPLSRGQGPRGQSGLAKPAMGWCSSERASFPSVLWSGGCGLFHSLN